MLKLFQDIELNGGNIMGVDLQTEYSIQKVNMTCKGIIPSLLTLLYFIFIGPVFLYNVYILVIIL